MSRSCEEEPPDPAIQFPNRRRSRQSQPRTSGRARVGFAPERRWKLTTAGLLLVAGFAVFIAGAAGWRLEYQAPLPERLHTLHADRGRLRWIHSLMTVAMLLTPAGLAAVAGTADHAAVWVAAAVYGLGSVPWLLNLTFRLTVQEREAERSAAGEDVPEWYPALDAWAGLGHRLHMLASYASAVPLAWGLAEIGLVPDWLAWSGALWGIAWFAGYAIPRTRFAFEPPFWAHVFTLAVGIALL